MASKEVMASAPVIVLLMDRTFISGSFRQAWNTRKKFYLALAATWLLLLLLIISSRGRGGTVTMSGDSLIWQYALTQCFAIIHYLRLTFWPDQLALDYGIHFVSEISEVWPQIIALALLLGGAFWFLWRNQPVGFLAILFFAVLAPTSSIIPVITQTMAEHRMYLALLPVIILVMLWAHTRLKYAQWGALGIVIAGALGTATYLRNNDYRTALSIWTDTAQKRPGNFRAWSALGNSQVDLGLFTEAKLSFETALTIYPDEAEVVIGLAAVFYKIGQYNESLRLYQKVVPTLRDKDPLIYGSLHNYGLTLAAVGKIEEAIQTIRRAMALKPKIADAYYSLGNALMSAKKPEEAVLEFQKALERDPELIMARANLGNALIALNRPQEAIAMMSAGSPKSKSSAELRYNLGLAEMNLGHTDKAIALYQEALTINPRFAKAHINLGLLLDPQGKTAQASEHYQEAIRWGEPNPVLHAALGRSLITLGRIAEGTNEFEKAVRLAPDDIQLRYFFARAQMQNGQPLFAAQNFEIIARQSPDIPEVMNGLGLAYRQLGRNTEAREQFRAALKLRPDYEEARRNLEETPR
jgi:tetratricopeptide (TPR) repeat protein